jgi:argininosuccinate lyase
LAHTHEGSIGNLCNTQIADEMKKVLNRMDFEKVDKQIEHLLKS